MSVEELSIPEAASILGVSTSVIRRWCKQGVIPTHTRKKSVFFLKNELVDWGQSRHIFPSSRSACQTSIESASLSQALKRGGVFNGIIGKTHSELYFKSISKIVFIEDINLNLMHQTLVEREAMATTAVGMGIALPHPRTPDLLNLQHSYVATFYLDEKIDFHPHDGQPIFCAFIILATNTTTHLKLMSQLARAIHDPAFHHSLRMSSNLESLLLHLHE